MVDWNAMSDADFRQMVREFYSANYPPALRNMWHYLRWEEVRDWWALLYKKGWAAPAWPTEYGGMGLQASKLLIFHEERLDVSRGPDYTAVTMLGPVLIAFGTDAQRSTYLPKILSGEHLWAQGYSEPGAGSDLAGLSTTATLDGDSFVVNGQKIWTTWASDCSHIFALVRTDKSARTKQEGISFLLIDLKSEGVRVRPIKNIAGRNSFCEVFFDNVRVPKENIVGELNKGWTVAKALVGFERLIIGNPKHCLFALQRLIAVGYENDLFDDAAFADRVTQLRLDVEDLGTLYSFYSDIVKRGDQLPPDVSMLKLWATETLQRITELMIEGTRESGGTSGICDYAGLPTDPLAIYFMARATTIGAGTSEVQRNIMAKYTLQLPSM
jgi:alkylation response protein AidB-like acyl-CoA dehydrogenase